MRSYDRSIDRSTGLKAFAQDNQSFQTRTHIVAMMNERATENEIERERKFLLYASR